MSFLWVLVKQAPLTKRGAAYRPKGDSGARVRICRRQIARAHEDSPQNAEADRVDSSGMTWSDQTKGGEVLGALESARWER